MPRELQKQLPYIFILFQQRYSTYYSGIGSRIISSDISMEECEEYYKKNQPHGDVPSSKYEHLDVVFQRHLDACDHI
ncbi:hypothetical protein HF086_013477 [Spodoptera exigua]|uniref:Uncharacterized protein n=1 Tax=Spodoptera exigua TaxID=7107 RepID=A0A922SGU1_SPOEX|nr:hypothetical protein HF086_013477 [Spodoptera exigua]